jgi:DNA-binding CsgD family transcriptional regulator
MKPAAPQPRDIADLIGMIYREVAAEESTREMLVAFNEVVPAAATQLITWRASNGTVLNCEAAGELLEAGNRDYLAHWALADPRRQWLDREPMGQVLRCDQHLDSNFVSSSRFFQDFFLPKGLRWSLCARFPSGPGEVTAIAGARLASSPPFEEATAQTLRRLLPHLERAASIRLKLEHASAMAHSVTEMLKQLPTPCLITDHAGRCMEGNEAFSNHLEPLSLRLVTGRVRFTDLKQQKQWEMALFETHATALPQTMQFTAPNGVQWKVHLRPWHSMHDAEHPNRKLILTVFDDRKAEAAPQPGSAATAARLTRAEAEVLAGLLKGLPAKSIATGRSASVNTVRNQIVTILEKTGFKSQKELIASFSNSVVPESVFTGLSSQGLAGYTSGARRRP